MNANVETQIPIYLYRCTSPEKGSNEKLKYVGNGNGKYIALVDNDLVYPQDYFKNLIAGCERYNAHVSYHGCILYPRPLRSYYAERYVYRGLGSVPNDYEVDVASSCMTLFKREWHDDLHTWYNRCSDVSQDDLYVSLFHKDKGIKRYDCLS